MFENVKELQKIISEASTLLQRLREILDKIEKDGIVVKINKESST